MADDGETLLAMRIGPSPAEVWEVNKARQAALPPEQRAADPSAPARVVDRLRTRDQIERGRNEFRQTAADG